MSAVCKIMWHGLTISTLLFLFHSNSVYAAPGDPAGTCSSRADIWFAMDESGSVTTDEFNSGLDFLYQVSDAFVFDDQTGMQAGAIGWASGQTANVIIPVTENFGDAGDTGLISTTVITDGDSKGIRELYTAKQGLSNGTTLDFATNALTALIADNTDSNNDGVTNIRR